MNQDYNSNEQENKWEPDTEKFNSTVNEEKPAAPKKRRVRWWIPVIIVTAVVVIGICVASAFAVSAIKKYVSNSDNGSAIVSEIQKQIEEGVNELNPNATEEATEKETKNQVIIGESENTVKSSNSSAIYLTDVSDVVDQVMPSVVAITSRQLVSSGRYGNFFGYYYGYQSSGETQEVEAGTGSGTIVGQNSEEVLVLTSYHVVEGCSSLYVTLCDDSQIEGYVKSTSEEDDIAIVAMKLSDISDSTLSQIKMATLSNSQVDVGDGCIVIGNALGYGQSVVTGIISAIDREITVEGKSVTVIQTDAAINQGNSGGCLLNAQGEIVGISEAKINSSSVEGMCYAISVSHYYDKIIDMLNEAPVETEEENGQEFSISGNDEAQSNQTAYLGIQGYDVTSSVAETYGIPTGVYVVETVSGGGAQAGGILQGDVITGIKGKTITSMSELKAELAKCSVGDTVEITLVRYENTGYVEKSVKVTLTAQIG